MLTEEENSAQRPDVNVESQMTGLYICLLVLFKDTKIYAEEEPGVMAQFG